VIKQFKMPHLPCPVCGSDTRADKVLRDNEVRGAMIEALQECLREHGGFTIRGDVEKKIRFALSQAGAVVGSPDHG
jgi:hypothetical protein